MKGMESSAGEPSLQKTLMRGTAVWLLLMGAEVIHGIARTALLAPRTGDFKARQISVFSGSALILSITYLTISWIGSRNKSTLLRLGIAWLLLTLLFEFVLGRKVLHLSWQRLLSDYNLRKGGLQPIGLVMMTLAPLLMERLKRKEQRLL
ncbi:MULTISPECIES: hypothetical protein [Pontibacter]|uniref:Uncharacterized protein n=1 Tax=Pontibacter lucknowensis TaxID=1077936 RepID=A0A1N6ZJW3_9BACT|nr:MULTISPECIES: hypothetical protein [Pontibacter]EJF10443.1 hypothetical protein O71_09069 [Pontibacter sp. BAB1700]SIR27001.1 hypothetical protein SAMN05421545_3029 [Pontibacter lucknowensis]